MEHLTLGTAMDLTVSILALFGAYAFIKHTRFLLPRNVVPGVAAALNETQQLLHQAEAVGAIPEAAEFRTSLAM